MKVEDIVNKLCQHEISKYEAISELKEIINNFTNKGSLEFTVQSVGYTIQDNHGLISLKLPYEYRKIEGKLKEGDSVYVTFS